MAQRNEFLREKEEQPKEKKDFKEKLKKHRMSTIYKIVLVVAVLVVLAVIIIFQYQRHVYEDYEVISSVMREKAPGAVDIVLGDSVLTYSKDGAHCTATDGTVTWNQTYEIQDLLVSVDQGVIAITGYNQREVYVANEEKILYKVTTNMPIKNIAVSASGRVTTVVEEGNVTWINTYGSGGEMLYTGQARMNESGYPFSVCLSPNGEMLAISYLFLEAGNLKTNIAFYNFGQVGDNYNDYLVSTHAYSGLLVPELKFINDTTAIAVGDSRMMVYKGSQIPDSAAERLFDTEIEAVFFGTKYVGLVTRNQLSEEKYLLQVYNDEAKEVLSYPFDMEYRNILIDTDKVVICNESQLQIVTMKGMVKYDGSLDRVFNVLVPASSPYRFYLATDDSIDTIQLK